MEVPGSLKQDDDPLDSLVKGETVLEGSVFRAASCFGLLPQVYVPSFCLNYFRISQENGKIAVEYRTIEKTPKKELTLVQRVMASRRHGKPLEPIPERTLLDA